MMTPVETATNLATLETHLKRAVLKCQRAPDGLDEYLKDNTQAHQTTDEAMFKAGANLTIWLAVWELRAEKSLHLSTDEATMKIFVHEALKISASETVKTLVVHTFNKGARAPYRKAALEKRGYKDPTNNAIISPSPIYDSTPTHPSERRCTSIELDTPLATRPPARPIQRAMTTASPISDPSPSRPRKRRCATNDLDTPSATQPPARPIILSPEVESRRYGTPPQARGVPMRAHVPVDDATYHWPYEFRAQSESLPGVFGDFLCMSIPRVGELAMVWTNFPGNPADSSLLIEIDPMRVIAFAKELFHTTMIETEGRRCIVDVRTGVEIVIIDHVILRNASKAAIDYLFGPTVGRLYQTSPHFKDHESYSGSHTRCLTMTVPGKPELPARLEMFMGAEELTTLMVKLLKV
ncbi:hypothetical protein Micbo1qcDRAFT_62919 [Microdochium bolleyi]|uniref:Uncharacterized protein n=1 Tax=Microdochium bolleyi TaxID=196109 RepID=A0A136IJA1_9PEZI|nr:hypothetical protein Micbo1qcDRAFT_62919 [Microdochium bolleyi]